MRICDWSSVVFFFKQKTAYEMRISDWSSDVCSSDLRELLLAQRDSLRERLDRVRQDARQHKDHAHQLAVRLGSLKAQYDSTRQALERQIGRASCRERVCQYV